ncbi:hypothetical protein [Pseudoflavonifractor capillosus]|uniref:hypothetical protein n=1 Tax=Pseudoflavonifractor capillosus TaxID=106588 RepID=UPI0012F6A832|nr:hypothetical protein [Pseudoflavonifractor capillosus]
MKYPYLHLAVNFAVRIKNAGAKRDFTPTWNIATVLMWRLSGSHPKPNRNPAQNEKTRRKRYVACDELVPVTGLEPVRCRQRRILSYSSHSEPNGLNRNKTVFSVTFQNIKNPKKPYKISIFDAKHQKYKQFVPSSIIGSQIPNLRRWRDVGGM